MDVQTILLNSLATLCIVVLAYIDILGIIWLTRLYKEIFRRRKQWKKDRYSMPYSRLVEKYMEEGP